MTNTKKPTESAQDKVAGSDNAAGLDLISIERFKDLARLITKLPKENLKNEKSHYIRKSNERKGSDD